jgi:hypothetical protein
MEGIIKLIQRGEAPGTSNLASAAGQRGRPDIGIAGRYLQDLAPEDIPENQRQVITSEIAQFRERAAKKAAEKRAAEEARRASHSAAYRAGSGGGGQGGRGQMSPAVQQNGWGPRGGQQQQAPEDPQSYNKPIGFVASGSKASPGTPVVKEEVDPNAPPVFHDEQKERERQAKERHQNEIAFNEMERRIEGRERQRINAVERERARERGMAEAEDRERALVAERLSTWDDDREADRGRELFYSDRCVLSFREYFVLCVGY